LAHAQGALVVQQVPGEHEITIIGVDAHFFVYNGFDFLGGVVGELHVHGDGLACSYLHKQAKPTM